MAVPELVVVPARPRIGAECPVEFEVRGQADGQWVLPVFSSVAALVRELGCYQPWVCVPWRLAAEAAGRARLTQVVLDPGAGTLAQRWTAAHLTAHGGEAAADG